MSTLQNELMASHIGATALFGFRGDVKAERGKHVARAADPPVARGHAPAANPVRRAQGKLSLAAGSGASDENWKEF